MVLALCSTLCSTMNEKLRYTGAYFPKWALIKRRLQKVYRICNCKVEQYRERLAQALREEMYGTALYNGKGGLIKGRGRKSPFSLKAIFSKSEKLRLCMSAQHRSCFGGSVSRRSRSDSAFADVSSRDRHVKLRRRENVSCGGNFMAESSSSSFEENYSTYTLK